MVAINYRMGDFTLTHLTRFEAYDRSEGLLDFLMKEMSSFNINHTQEEVDITGADGRVIGKKKKNKSVNCDGANGVICDGLLKAQLGGEIVNGNMTIKKTETKKLVRPTGTGANYTVVIDYDPIGTVGQEIGKVQLIGTAGAVLKEYRQGTTVSATQFTFSPATKTITLPTDPDIEEGLRVTYAYYRTVQGNKINDPFDKYSEVREVWLHGYGTDICDNAIAYAWHFPRADISGEFALDIGGDQAMHNFSFQALPDLCDDDDNDLYNLYIYQDGKLIAVNPDTANHAATATDQEVKAIFS